MQPVFFHSILTFLILLTLSGVYSVPLFAASGRLIFEKAYRLEKKKPAESARLYRLVLGRRLKPRLRNAAHWRLFYLYQDIGEYHRALLLFRRLNKRGKSESVAEGLYRSMERRYGLQPRGLRYYIRGLTLLFRKTWPHSSSYKFAPFSATRASSRSDDMIRAFQDALNISSDQDTLKTDLKKTLAFAGRSELYDSIIHANRPQTPLSELRKAEELTFEGRGKKAESILRKLSQGEGFADGNVRSKHLYLLGRIYQSRRLYRTATAYFRLAAREADPLSSSRFQALASYSLYLAGYPLQAHALLRGMSLSGNKRIRLLQLSLRADGDGDPAAFRLLRREKKNVLRGLKRDKKSFLYGRAIRLIRRGTPLPRRRYRSNAATLKEINTDLDFGSYWDREQIRVLGNEVLLQTSMNGNLYLFRQIYPMQFHGIGPGQKKFRPVLKKIRRIDFRRGELGPLLAGLKGYYTFLIRSKGKRSKPSYQALEIRSGNARFKLINIVCYGDGSIRLEAERRDEIREYYNWSIKRLYLYRPAIVLPEQKKAPQPKKVPVPGKVPQLKKVPVPTSEPQPVQGPKPTRPTGNPPVGNPTENPASYPAENSANNSADTSSEN